MNDLTIIVLAAGKGTRMKSAKAKVLHEVFYRPMLHHVLHATTPLNPRQTVVILGHQKDEVEKSLHGFQVDTVIQKEQLGTGHAVQVTEPTVKDKGEVMILCGDTPLIRPESLMEMAKQHREIGADITVMTTIIDNPFGYGRIISEDNAIQAIVEEKETNDVQKKIKEINAGIYLVERDYLFSSLQHLTPDNSQGEFYLTDIVEHSVKEGKTVYKYINPNVHETLGVNSRVELEAAHKDLQYRRNVELMQQGITMTNVQTISIAPEVEVKRDCLIMPGVHITGSSKLAEEIIIENGVIIRDCIIENNAHIGAYSVLEGCHITESTTIAPFSHIKE